MGETAPQPRRDPYSILGVDPDATGEEIALAFRRLTAALDSRPIRAALSEAYATLRDPLRRAELDLAAGRARLSAAPDPDADALLAPGLDAVLVAPGLGELRTEVLAVDDAHVLVAPPVAGDVVVALEPGAEVELRLGRRDDASYRLPARVRQGLGQAGADASYFLEPLGQPDRDQRRAYVRLPAVVAVQVRRSGDPTWRLARVLDLSAGGLRVLSGEEWPVSTRLEVRLAIPYREVQMDVEGEAVVVRGEGPAIGGNRASGWIHGLELVDLRPGDRDRITRAVLWAQAERRLGADALAD